MPCLLLKNTEGQTATSSNEISISFNNVVPPFSRTCHALGLGHSTKLDLAPSIALRLASKLRDTLAESADSKANEAPTPFMDLHRFAEVDTSFLDLRRSLLHLSYL